MKASETPFMGLWWGIDLGEARPCDGTYCGYAYETLPPLDMSLFKGEFQWLGELSEARKEQMALYHVPEAREGLKKGLEAIQAEAKKLSLSLPPEFIKWMASLELQDQIPSSTACYFSIGETIIPSPLADGSYLLGFYNDQQDVLLWYLYLNTNGDHAVVASPIGEEEFSEVSKEDFQKETFFCGESFESFLYRLWIENRIWFGLDEGAEMDEVQKAYLGHYG
jgi:hypothetical protein